MTTRSAWVRLWPVWLIPAVLLIANVVWMAGLRASVLGHGSLLERQVADLEASLARMEQQKAELEQARVSLATLTRDLEALRSEQLRPMRERLVPFLIDIVRRAGDAGLAPESISYQAQLDEKSGLVHFAANYGLRGTYQQVRRYVELLEASPHFAIIEKISLRGSADPTSLEVNIAMSVGTYFSDIDERLLAEIREQGGVAEPATPAPPSAPSTVDEEVGDGA